YRSTVLRAPSPPLFPYTTLFRSAATIAQAMVRGVDAVAKPSFLAHFGKQPRAHSAAENADGAPRLKIIGMAVGDAVVSDADLRLDRKSTRLHSSHVKISYAVFCL